MIASDYPSHRSLPFNKMISFFNLKEKNSLSNALRNIPNIDLEKKYLKEITVDKIDYGSKWREMDYKIDFHTLQKSSSSNPNG